MVLRFRAREGVRRNALRVLCPKSPHSEEAAQHIEWRDPRGHAAVWLQGSVVQGRHDRLQYDIPCKSICVKQDLFRFLRACEQGAFNQSRCR